MRIYRCRPWILWVTRSNFNSLYWFYSAFNLSLHWNFRSRDIVRVLRSCKWLVALFLIFLESWLIGKYLIFFLVHIKFWIFWSCSTLILWTLRFFFLEVRFYDSWLNRSLRSSRVVALSDLPLRTDIALFTLRCKTITFILMWVLKMIILVFHRILDFLSRFRWSSLIL